MPTYEYKCDGCDHVFERFQKMTASPLRTCPECGARKLRRLIGTGAGIIFKGSGFYATDYRSSGYKDAARKEKQATSGSDDTSSSKSSTQSAGTSGSSSGTKKSDKD